MKHLHYYQQQTKETNVSHMAFLIDPLCVITLYSEPMARKELRFIVRQLAKKVMKTIQNKI